MQQLFLHQSKGKMARYSSSTRRLLLWLCALQLFVLLSLAARPSSSPSSRYRAVNLGGWLVTEGWIKPSLFAGIPNNDLLDGNEIQLMSVTQRKYLAAEKGGGSIIVANRTSASGWESFSLWRLNESTFQMRVFNKQFIGLDNQGPGLQLVAVATKPGPSETFEIVRNKDDKNRVRIKAPNGYYVQVATEHSVTADFSDNSNWGDDDPSVFTMRFAGTMQGEFQITNGYDREKAADVLRVLLMEAE